MGWIARRRDEQRAEQLSVLLDRLTAVIAELRTGQDWRRWLDVARRCHDDSFANTLLILAQRPGATRVAGYWAWQQN